MKSLALRRLTAIVGLVGIIGASVSGCGGASGNSGNSGGSGGGGTGTGNYNTQGGTPGGAGFSGRAACQANTHQSGRVRWTVLVYINAANDLQPFSLLNVGQMASVGSDSNVNIVIQWKQSAECNSSSAISYGGCGSPSFDGTRRYLLKQHNASDVAAIEAGNTTVLDNDRLPDPSTNVGGTSDMGDYHTLQNFVQWGSSNYPADNLAVVIWDHGSGWQSAIRRITKTQGGKTVVVAPKLSKSHAQKPHALSQDYSTLNEIETTELPDGLANTAQPIDMLLIDCSLQMMAEIAYQVKGSARVMLGSEDSPPGAGYPYDYWLSDLKAGGQNPCVAGQSMINRFIAEYSDGTKYTDVTQSIIDLSKMNAVGTALNNMAGSLNSHISDQGTLITSAQQNVQYYTNEYPYYNNKDLYDYAELIRSQTTATDLKQAAYNLEVALLGANTGAIMMAQHGSSNQSGSYGMAIWIPDSSTYQQYPSLFSLNYTSLALSQAAPNWPTFLGNQP